MTGNVASLVRSARIEQAPVWRVALACLLDALLLATCITAAVLSLRAGQFSLAVVLGWGVLAGVTLQMIALVNTGQTLAWQLFRVRLVSLDGYPGLGMRRAQGSRFFVADVMRGADPLHPLSALPDMAASAAAAASLTVAPGFPEATSTASGQGRAAQRRAAARQADPSATWQKLRNITPADTFDADTFEAVGEDTIFAERATPQWRLRLDGSDIGPLMAPTVFGRNPSPEDGVRTVTVMDLTREVSKQHVRVSLTERGGVQVEDLGSTNGTTFAGADDRLVAGQPYRLTEHQTVTFSGHTLEITRKGAAA